MHPSEEASALLFPATELFKAAASVKTWLERFTYTHYPSLLYVSA